jgi:long-chain acyl-CoA synthetase
MSIQWLFDRMTQWSEDPAIIWSDKVTTYADMLLKIEKWQSELDVHEVKPGSVVAICGDYSPNACALMLALIDRGMVVVPLSLAAEVHWREFIEIAEVEHIFFLDKNDDWRYQGRDISVSHPLLLDLRSQFEPGLVLFSSGSTGKSKAALHNFTLLLDKFQVLRQRLCTLTFLLLDHIGGINTLFYTLSNGGSVVSVRSRDPEEICRAIETYKVQLLPTSPTFLNLLLISEAYKRFDLSSLSLVTYGTEVMPESTLQRINEVLPNVKLQQTYGLSELGILRSKSKSNDSLWVKVGGEGFDTKIVDGILWIKAHSAMLGYLNAPSPFDAEGWMNTGDMVEAEGEYIKILGRKSEIINVGGQKVYPSEVESVLLQLENVKDAVVFGEPNPITGNIVSTRINLFQPEDPREFRRRMVLFCRSRLANYKIPVKVELSDQEQYNQRYKRMRKADQSVK